MATESWKTWEVCSSVREVASSGHPVLRTTPAIIGSFNTNNNLNKMEFSAVTAILALAAGLVITATATLEAEVDDLNLDQCAGS